MNQKLFNTIFNNDILPFIKEIGDNNSMIALRDLEACKEELYEKYSELNRNYKEQIFTNGREDSLLDRHKIASCICGAFLWVPVFDKTRLMKYLQNEGKKVEVYFYYVNELAAFYAASKFLAFFMIDDQKAELETVRAIVREFPKAPSVTKNKRGFWNSVLFNMAQIKDKGQIGLEHYDVYSYAMFFFWLEHYFNEQLSAQESKNC